MIYSIKHVTTYTYSEPVSLAHHLLRLCPRNSSRQNVLEHHLVVAPVPVVWRPETDYYGNPVTFVSLEGDHDELIVTSAGRIEVLAPKNPALADTPPWESVVKELSRGPVASEMIEACDFIYDSPMIRAHPEFADYAKQDFTPGCPLLEATMALTTRIFKDFKFDPKATTVATPVEEVFKNRRGVCQDFAQFEIACLRSLGLPARYVSGYLETIPPPGKPRMAGADASHAWISVFCPGSGWIDLDPTNNLLTSTRHVTVVWGRDYSDVSPIRGVILGSGAHKLKVAVDVIPLQ